MRRALPIRLGKAISAFCVALRHSAHPGAAFFVVFSFLALVILGTWGTAVGIQTAWDIHREFRAMTPADHLRGTDAASAIRDYERALQHLSAIPPEAPEFSKAAMTKEEQERTRLIRRLNVAAEKLPLWKLKQLVEHGRWYLEKYLAYHWEEVVKHKTKQKPVKQKPVRPLRPGEKAEPEVAPIPPKGFYSYVVHCSFEISATFDQSQVEPDGDGDWEKDFSPTDAAIEALECEVADILMENNLAVSSVEAYADFDDLFAFGE